MASNDNVPTAVTSSINKKLRVLLIPILATSHIGPFTELAISLAATNDAVEATVAVTPANVSIVQSMLEHRGGHSVKVATYPFPAVDGLPEGVENFGSAATPEQSMCIMVATKSEALTRPVHETLIRSQSPDAVVTDMTFLWNSGIAAELGVPCVVFSVMGAFSMLAMHHLEDAGVDRDDQDDDDDDDAVVEVPGFPGPPIRIPRTELPGFLRRPDYSITNLFISLKAANCFGLAMNTSSELEKQYCELYTTPPEEGGGGLRRAYFLGPLALALPPPISSSSSSSSDCCSIMAWLDSKPSRSVVYVSFGSMAHVKDVQLDELALGLETSGISFLWVVRGREEWSPPKGWEARVQDRGFIIRAWAPQISILGHHAAGAFVTQCGWNSVLETVAAAVPMLTWPLAFEQFITERLVTDVLGIGVRLWPDGAGLRSESYQEHEVIPRQDVARALVEFMRPAAGGPSSIRDMARTKLMDLSAKLHAAVAQGGSSHRDLHRLVDDLLMEAAAKRPRT
uniref:Glycosyltransferase n=1 Tax=Avena strigosa TaxID=38783 RepID=C4MF38_9POAL|nr:UDP-glycosyltransferase UGT705A4 [Avena strigosa]AZQ26932.1 UGT705A4 [Avena strigosa]